MALSKTQILLQQAKTKLTWIGIAAGLVVLLSLAINKKMNSKVVDVHVQITKVKSQRSLINKKDVLRLFSDHLGYDIDRAQLKELKIVELENIVESDRRVKSSEVYIDAKNTLHVDIVQRNPIVRINADNGEKYYLDDAGNKIPLKKKSAVRVPIATGNIAKYQRGFVDAKDRNSLNDIFDLMNAIKEDPFIEALVEQIHLDGAGEIILIPKLGREKILFGKYEDVKKKFFNLKAFYKEEMPREGWGKFAQLDIRYRGQVFYSPL